MHVKPTSDPSRAKVRDPVTKQFLPPEGLTIVDVDGVPSDPYWQRLLRDKDVEVVKPADIKPPSPPPALAKADEKPAPEGAKP